jgi:uncharacterized membrane protein (DUF485 family)
MKFMKKIDVVWISVLSFFLIYFVFSLVLWTDKKLGIYGGFSAEESINSYFAMFLFVIHYIAVGLYKHFIRKEKNDTL